MNGFILKFKWLLSTEKIFNNFFSQARLIETNLHRISIDEENESQNDLVREFSMQVHHEQFSITASGFFHVNLDLLGSVMRNNSESFFKCQKDFNFFRCLHR